jgi:peptide/nickel transport system substrate-binding protein
MGRRNGARATWTRLGAVLLVVASLAAACGDDDDDDDAGDTSATTAATADETAGSGEGATTSPAGEATTTSAAEEDGEEDDAEGVVGGEATILQWSESPSMDSVAATGASGTDAMRMFSVYGALVTFDPAEAAVVPVLAESFEPNDDFTSWTITLRPDLVFSDQTPFDAEAVRVNWERIKDPANRSPAAGTAATIATLTVVDELTLEAALVQPNAAFPNAVSRTALNYVASPAAIASGHDLANQPIGAGPFLLESWTRDDRMELVRNPDWFDAPRPYLDRLTIRVVTDPTQRADTFATGDADGYYITAQEHADLGIERRDAELVSVQLSSGFSVLFNNTVPPFDDPRVRRAIAMGFDRDVTTDIGYPGQVGTHNYTLEATPFYTEDAALPPYDPEGAQALIDEVVAERGEPITFTLWGTTNPQNTSLREFIQTSLNQLDGIEVETEGLDSPTFVPRILQGDFEVTTWGYPWRDPEPLLYTNFHSGLPSNLGRYSNPDVDAAFEAGRASTDLDERAAAYSEMFTIFAEEIPYIPVVDPVQGYVLAAEIQGGQVYEDGTLRTDLIWRAV